MKQNVFPVRVNFIASHHIKSRAHCLQEHKAHYAHDDALAGVAASGAGGLLGVVRALRPTALIGVS